VTDLYVKTLEKEIEENNKLLSRIGELVDEGVYTSSIKSANIVFKKIGELIGLNMTDVDDDIWDDDDSWDDLDDWRDD